jgi:hypothetical protein
MSCAGGPDLITDGLVLEVSTNSRISIPTTSTNPFPLNNIITRSLYANISTTNMTYSSDYGGSLVSNSSGSGFTASAGAWTNLGLTNNFTINILFDVISITGINISGLILCENYLTRGFRAGFYGNTGIYSFYFWATESGGTFDLVIPNTVFKLPERLFVTMSFDSTTGIGKVYKNGILAGQSASGRTIISPNSSNSISFNSILNSTSTNIKFLYKSIYNRALKDLEVLQNYNNLKGRLTLT